MGSRKVIIGILGGIGSGKSSVAAQLGKLGCGVIDADAIVHDLLDDKDVKSRLIKAFGSEICSEEGLIHRGKLADIVFDNVGNVARINEIIHPLVSDRTTELIAQYSDRSEIKAIVLDVPLLAEVGWIDMCDKLVFVDCPDQIRADRARKKGLSYEKQLKKREKFQISLDRKAEIAHYIVHNNSDLSVLADQVAQIFSTLTK